VNIGGSWIPEMGENPGMIPDSLGWGITPLGMQPSPDVEVSGIDVNSRRGEQGAFFDMFLVGKFC